MNFGDFLDNNSCGAVSGARIVTDNNIPYNNPNNTIVTTTANTTSGSNMPPGATLLLPNNNPNMFSSPGLSLALVTLQDSTFFLFLALMCEK